MRKFLLACCMLAMPFALLADNWMSRLADNVLVSQVSIPGSHDSGTGYGGNNYLLFISFDTYARTQDKNIPEQLELGVRAFDLRPNNALDLYHGIMKTKTTLAASLNAIRDFLKANPSEFVIVVMRHETDGDNGSANWGTNVTNLLKSSDYAGYLADYHPNLTVGNLRGKMLILSRDDYATTPYGGFIHDWGHDSSFSNQQGAKIIGPTTQGRLFVQDYYEFTQTNGMATKTSSIKAMLDYSTGRATASDNENVWVINHTAGYAETTSAAGVSVVNSDAYRKNAATQNAAVIEYLQSHHGPTGIIVMDQAGVDTSNKIEVKGLALTNAIIENNFTYTPKTNEADMSLLLRMIDEAEADGMDVSDFRSRYSSLSHPIQYDELYHDVLFGRKVFHIEQDPATYAGNKVGAGDYYLYNVGRKSYLTSGSDWGTHAALGYPGLVATLAANNGGYTLQFNELLQGSARDKYLGGSPYVDCANDGKGTYTFEPVSGKTNVYYIKGDRGYLAFDPEGNTDGEKYFNTVTGEWSTPKNEDAQWMLVSKADRLAKLDEATPTSPRDATVIVRDASFNKFATVGSPWSGIEQGWGFDDRTFGDKNTEKWNSQAFTLSQTVTFPKRGIYEVSVQAYYRDGTREVHASRVKNGTTLTTAPNLFVGSETTPLMYIHEEADRAPNEGWQSEVGNFPDNMKQASLFFQNGLYKNTLRVIIDADNTSLSIGIKKNSGCLAEDWIVADNFRVTYLGEGTVTLPLTSGYATFSAPMPYAVQTAGVNAYKADSHTKTEVNITNIGTEIPANTGVVLYGEGADQVVLTPLLSSTVTVDNNLLEPNLDDYALPQRQIISGTLYKNYILGTQDSDEVKFYLSSGSGTLAGGRAYLHVPQDSDTGAKLNITGDDITAIEAVDADNAGLDTHPVYDLSGRRVVKQSLPKPTVVIVNGKKQISK